MQPGPDLRGGDRGSRPGTSIKSKFSFTAKSIQVIATRNLSRDRKLAYSGRVVVVVFSRAQSGRGVYVFMYF
jgi:hypothetical protein